MYSYLIALYNYIFPTAYGATTGDFCSQEVTNGFTNVEQCSNWILNHGSTSNSSTSLGSVITDLYQYVMDRSIDMVFDYWPTILVVAVTIGVAFFLISKALSAVRGHI